MQFTMADIWVHMGLFARFIVGVMAVMSVLAIVIAGDRAILFLKGRSESGSVISHSDHFSASNSYWE